MINKIYISVDYVYKKVIYSYISPYKYEGLLKGSLQTIILKLLKENQRMYVYEITQVVKEITSGEIQLTEGALYPALHKMENEGLLATNIEQVDNRVRKLLCTHGSG